MKSEKRMKVAFYRLFQNDIDMLTTMSVEGCYLDTILKNYTYRVENEDHPVIYIAIEPVRLWKDVQRYILPAYQKLLKSVTRYKLLGAIPRIKRFDPDIRIPCIFTQRNMVTYDELPTDIQMFYDILFK